MEGREFHRPIGEHSEIKTGDKSTVDYLQKKKTNNNKNNSDQGQYPRNCATTLPLAKKQH